MTNLEWLKENAKQVKSNLPDDNDLIWVTKDRGDYITRVGMEDKSFLPFEKFGVIKQVQSTWEAGKPINIGFNPQEQKWYGWSHRAIYGFTIGSEVKKGDCAYTPVDKEDAVETAIRFWTCDSHSIPVWDGKTHQSDYGDYIILTATYITDDVDKLPNESLWGKPWHQRSYLLDDYGKGEWTATTLEDAKQMAIDFANGVS